MKTPLTNRMAVPAENRQKPLGRPQKYSTSQERLWMPQPLTQALRPRLHHWQEITRFVEGLPLPTPQVSPETQTGGEMPNNEKKD